MNFFQLNVRQDFAGYFANKIEGEISDERFIPPLRSREVNVAEYLGVPVRKPGKRGDFHKSANGYFANQRAITLIQDACNQNIITSHVSIEGREAETFRQFWITNFVDCMNAAATIAGPPGIYSGKIGVIKRLEIDAERWDGSDLFVIPQDPSSTMVCTERFIDRWRGDKLRGAQFSRFRFDPDPIQL